MKSPALRQFLQAVAADPVLQAEIKTAKDLAQLVQSAEAAGFAITAGLAGHWLDPYSPAQLMRVTGTVSLLALAVTVLALRLVQKSNLFSCLQI